MKLAFISDTHVGEEMCTLEDHHTLGPGAKFDAFAKAEGRGNDFLVMLGDIFDFSIAPHEALHPRAKALFRLVRRRGIARNIVSMPGNHDFDTWPASGLSRAVVWSSSWGLTREPGTLSVPEEVPDTPSSPLPLPDADGAQPGASTPHPLGSPLPRRPSPGPRRCRPGGVR
jgi:hypothetical protein